LARRARTIIKTKLDRKVEEERVSWGSLKLQIGMQLKIGRGWDGERVVLTLRLKLPRKKLHPAEGGVWGKSTEEVGRE